MTVTMTLLAWLAAPQPHLPQVGPVPCRLWAAQSAFGQEAWKGELEEICALTNDAMTLSTSALQALVERSDRLLPRLEALEETPRKVYRKRLQKCRDLFVFVLQSRTKEPAK